MRLAFLFLLFAVSLAKAQDKFIELKANAFPGYIVPKEYATLHLKGIFAKEVAVFWTPTTAQVIAADQALKNLIWASKDKRATAYAASNGNYFEKGVPAIRKDFKNYFRRFVGIVTGGREQIACYYLLHGMPSELFPLATDQGTGFWGGTYDLTSKACSSLWIDGNG